MGDPFSDPFSRSHGGGPMRMDGGFPPLVLWEEETRFDYMRTSEVSSNVNKSI